MTRVIDEKYYNDVELLYRIRIGEIVKPVVQHSNYDDYDLTRKESITARIRYLRSRILDLKAEHDTCYKEFRSGKRPYGFMGMEFAQARMDKLEKAIEFNRERLKTKEDKGYYDIETTAKIPLDQIIEILPSGFFQNNPFRNEESPSNSLHWDKKTNRWMDFGSGDSGDAIDLYQAIHDCDLPTALKELQSFL